MALDISLETPVLQTDLRNYIPLIARGKVREIYELDKSTLLFVTTDRISGLMVIHLPSGSSLLTIVTAYDVTLKNVWLHNWMAPLGACKLLIKNFKI